MADDSITGTLDDTLLTAEIIVLDNAMQIAINGASKETAAAVTTEAKARLRRQLGPDATGATEAGITNKPAFDGNGYVVLSEREHVNFSLHTSKRSGRTHTQKVTQSNVPIWIEKGIRKGAARSHAEPARHYFYVSADVEAGAHKRRVEDALQVAINESGLGD